MTQDQKTPWRPDWGREGVIAAAAFGGFLILVGIVFAVNTNLPTQIENFFQNMSTTSFPVGSSSGFMLPAPIDPAAHEGLYSALIEFDTGFGLLQALILLARFIVRSPVQKIAETVDHMIFWLGAAYLTVALLLPGTLSGWFEYWGALIALVGFGLIVRGLILMVARRRKPSNIPT